MVTTLKREIQWTQSLKLKVTNGVMTDVYTPPVIETHGLTKTYKGVQALQPLDL